MSEQLPPVTEQGRGHTAETLVRTAQVVRWLVSGFGTREIKAMAADEWGLSSRQVDRLLSYARQDITDAWQVERSELVALLLSRCDEVYRSAMVQSNPGAAIAAVTTAAKLARL